MALSILDGTQTATTLSTILSSGQHITAHTVVSLGTQAITDMRGAVSGSVVSISNFPATQPVSIASVTIGNTVTIAGTVTANLDPNASVIASQIETGIASYAADLANDPLPISGTVTVGGFSGNAVTTGYTFNGNAVSSVPVIGTVDVSGGFITVTTSTNRIGVVTIGAGTVTLGASTSQIGSVTASISGTVPVSISSVTVGNSVTIGSALPAGTNRIGVVTIGGGTVTIGAGTAQIGSVTASISNSLTISSLPAISGTVTANVPNIQVCTQGAFAQTSAIQTALGVINENNTSQVLAVFGGEAVEGEGTSAFVQVRNQISGTVTASVSNFSSIASDGGGNAPPNGIQLGFSAGEEDYRIVDPSNPLPVTASGTVTANSSNGSLTTRFGSVTTANTAFATSAVTNTNRKYLLIQNITTASNVITVGIGFTPTTTQGIQLFAGAGLTFEGSYIPTGAVNLLSSVTASCYTILEA